MLKHITSTLTSGTRTSRSSKTARAGTTARMGSSTRRRRFGSPRNPSTSRSARGTKNATPPISRSRRSGGATSRALKTSANWKSVTPCRSRSFAPSSRKSWKCRGPRKWTTSNRREPEPLPNSVPVTLLTARRR